MQLSNDGANDDRVEGRSNTGGPFAVEIAGHGVVVRCRPEHSVLREMIAAGHRSLAVGCRSGGCGVCRVEVLSGDYTTGHMTRAVISKEDEKSGIVLACRLHAASDMRIVSRPLGAGAGAARSHAGLAA